MVIRPKRVFGGYLLFSGHKREKEGDYVEEVVRGSMSRLAVGRGGHIEVFALRGSYLPDCHQRHEQRLKTYRGTTARFVTLTTGSLSLTFDFF